jgi:hypothetical protein
MSTDPTGYLNDQQLAKQENAHYRSDQAEKEAAMSNSQKDAMKENERLEHVQDEIEHPDRQHLDGAEKYTKADVLKVVRNPYAAKAINSLLDIQSPVTLTSRYRGNFSYLDGRLTFLDDRRQIGSGFDQITGKGFYCNGRISNEFGTWEYHVDSIDFDGSFAKINYDARRAFPGMDHGVGE